MFTKLFGSVFEAAIDIIDGLSEGEIRERAALRLGVNVVAGMALAELVEFLKED